METLPSYFNPAGPLLGASADTDQNIVLILYCTSGETYKVYNTESGVVMEQASTGIKYPKTIQLRSFMAGTPFTVHSHYIADPAFPNKDYVTLEDTVIKMEIVITNAEDSNK